MIFLFKKDKEYCRSLIVTDTITESFPVIEKASIDEFNLDMPCMRRLVRNYFLNLYK